jgi:hypothetical protein
VRYPLVSMSTKIIVATTGMLLIVGVVFVALSSNPDDVNAISAHASESELVVNDGALAPGARAHLGFGYDILKMEIKADSVLVSSGPTKSFAENTLGIALERPAWATYRPSNKANGKSSSIVETSATDSQNSWGLDLSLSGEAKGVTGSASASLESSASRTADRKTAIATTTKDIEMYTLQVNQADVRSNGMKDEDGNDIISTGLKSALDKMSKDSNQDDWIYNIFDVFGTHYVSTVRVGGQLKLHTTATVDSSSNSNSFGFTGSLEASVDKGTKSGSGSVGGSISNSLQHDAALENSQMTYSCSGGDTSICSANGDFDAQEWLATIKENPTVIKTGLSEISSLITDNSLRAAAKAATSTYLDDQAKKCPGYKGNTVACNGNGACDSDDGKCFCDATHTGSACELKVIGRPPLASAPNTVDLSAPNGQVILGKSGDDTYRAKASVCNGGVLDTQATKCWNLDRAPISKTLKDGGSCKFDYMDVPEGLCVHAYALWGGWGNFGTGQDSCPLGQDGGAQEWGGGCTAGGPNHYPTHNSVACGYQISVQPGYGCPN